jgi:hypothetical protein
MAISTVPGKSKRTRSQPKQRDKSHIDVYLVVRGIDPQETSRLLGITPTKTWLAGDLVHPPAIHRYKDDGWVLKANYSRGVELTRYVEALIEQIKPSADRFHQLPAAVKVYVECAICDYQFRRTQLALSKKAVRGIARLGAELDIDYYDLSKSDA